MLGVCWHSTALRRVQYTNVVGVALVALGVLVVAVAGGVIVVAFVVGAFVNVRVVGAVAVVVGFGVGVVVCCYCFVGGVVGVYCLLFVAKKQKCFEKEKELPVL